MRQVILGLLLAASPVAAQNTDVIRGRVTGPDSLPIQGVNVRATSYLGRVEKRTTTDHNGRFTLVYINGEGDYWLDFTKLGFAPKRFEVKRFGEEAVLIADARLSSTIATLDRVSVTAPGVRALPNRNARDADVSGGDRPLTTNSGLGAADPGNLAAMAAGVPGFQLIPGIDGAADMFSFLGLSGDMNNMTFNGLGSGITAIPPDILANTSIRPYSFDPSVGGFAGAQVSIITIPGSNFSRRSITSSGVSPQLQFADRVATAQGQQFTNVRLGGNAAGAIAMNTSFYNLAWNASRRSSGMQSLFDADSIALSSAGVAPDSARRLRDILAAQLVPTSRTSDLPSSQRTDAGQVALNVDWSPSASGAGHAFTLAGLGDYQRQTGAAGRASALLATPSHNNENQRWGANAALVHTNYFWFGVLSKTTLGYAGSSASASPFRETPQGVVTVRSALDDGSTPVRRLAFGGAPQEMDVASRTLQVTNQMNWYSGNNRHALRLTTGLTHDGFTSDLRSNQLGTFSFNSLADLEAQAPSSFARSITSTTNRASQLSAVAALGDFWRPTELIQVQYGIRVEGNRFLDQPRSNDAIHAAVGLANGPVPDRVYVSPRAGLQWLYGEAKEIVVQPGAARGPRGIVHAGVGVFQNMASAQLVAPAIASTGLAGSAQTITCVGSSVPFPDWPAFENANAIPTSCVGGGSNPEGQITPSATMFDAGYRQPRALRAAADWASSVFDNRFVLGVQGIVSRGMNQSGWIDANFDPTIRFTLDAEGGRPVFADPSAIVQATGAISPAASRRSSDFQRLTLNRSDLSIDSRQLSVNVAPITTSPFLRWDLTYTLLDVRERYYGFTSTARNPLEVAWGDRQQGGRHSVQLSWLNFPVFNFVYLSATTRFSSGQRYTPMVAGDVNGDGLANDRAFVFPAADPSVGGAMQSLLDHATPEARRCLEQQVNALADRGSCEAPWTATALVQVRFNPVKLRLPQRASLGLTIQNPLGLADMALHGEDDLRGWGQAIPPDQSLLFVRGFDPVTRQFRYDVNERFGSTRPRQNAVRSLPFVSLGLSVDIGTPRERQVLSQRLDIGRTKEGDRQAAAVLKQLGMSAIPNPMLRILQAQDSLHLTQRQADSLAWLSRKYSVLADSVWTPAAKRLAELPRDYDRGEAWAQFVSAREQTVDYLLTVVPLVNGVLTPGQRRKLPRELTIYLDPRVLRFIRSSTAGDLGLVIGR